MKLDKIKFAQVIAYLGRIGLNIGMDEIADLDSLIDIEVPEVQNNYPATSDINMLMHLLYEGKQKIAAIKQYRILTGMGLKESKDAIEKHWGLYDSPDAKLLARIRQALGTCADGDELVQVAKNARRNADQLASQHNCDSEPATLGDILRTVSKD